MTLLAGVGALVCLSRWRDERYRIPIVLSVLWLALLCGRPTWGKLLDLLPLTRDFYLHRLIAGVHLAGLFLIAIAVAAAWRWGLARRNKLALLLPLVVTVLTLWPAFQERLTYLADDQRYFRVNQRAYARERADVNALLAKLHSLPPGRVYSGFKGNWGDRYDIGPYIPVHSLIMSSGLDTVGFLWHSWSVNGDLQMVFNEVIPEQYNLFNVRYVVAPDTQKFPAFVQPIGAFGRHRLYEVKTTGYFDLVNVDTTFRGTKDQFYAAAAIWLNGPAFPAKEHPRILFPGVPSPAGSQPPPLTSASAVLSALPLRLAPAGSILSETASDQRFTASVDVPTPTTVMLKVTAHPNWHAYVDGRPVDTEMLMPSFLGVPVSAGRHKIEFVYESAASRHWLIGLGVLTLLAVPLIERRRERIGAAISRSRIGPAVAFADGMLNAVQRVITAAFEAIPLTTLITRPAAQLTGRAKSVLASKLPAAAGPQALPGSDAAEEAHGTTDGSLGGLRARWNALSPVGKFAMIFSAALLLRVLLVPLYAYLPGGALDEYAWERWMQAIDRYGMLNVLRRANTDYVAYHWVLATLVTIYRSIGGVYVEYAPHPGQYAAFPFSLHALMKLPPLVFDAILIVVAYVCTRALARTAAPDARTTEVAATDERRATTLALIAGAIVAFHPVVLYDSAVWAQIDGGIAAAMLVAVTLISRGRPALGWAAWTIGFLIKPQPVVMLPVLLVLTYRRYGVLAVMRGAIVGLCVALVVLSPWLLHGELDRILAVYRTAFSARQYSTQLSLNAWNLWWISDLNAIHLPGNIVTSALPTVTYRLVGLALSASAAAIAALYVWRRPHFDAALLASAYMVFAFFMLPISVHERYLYPLVILLLPLVVVRRQWSWLYIVLSVDFFLNLFIVAPPVHDWSGLWVTSTLTLVIAIVNVVCFVTLSAALLRSSLLSWKRT